NYKNYEQSISKEYRQEILKGNGRICAVSASDKEPDLTIKPEEYLEVISTEDERIKIIGEELANDTGRAIFGKISQGVTSSNEIAKTLGISLPLVNWHVNRLLGVGLIKVEKIEMSQKNKQMKYYAPVKTALVIIPPENSSEKNSATSKKETVLTRLRHYLASIVSFVMVSSGIYIAEKNQTQQEVSYAPVTTQAPMMHAAIRAAPVQQTPPPPEPTIFASDPMMVVIALLGGAAVFCAVFFGIKFVRRKKQITK
ncbi:MAG: winged helix-turn-helix transcriptional regulator, partial [Thaumarchaeota archaeon]|nr:winged helix-turn-helix transcriptional regulator [Nitrososphaerota archaeon]